MDPCSYSLTFPLNLPHFQFVSYYVSSTKHFLSATVESKESQWSVVLTWSELWFNSINKSNKKESNIKHKHAIGHFLKQEFVFWHSTKRQNELFCLFGDCSETSVIIWCRTFHPLCLTCLQEREYFLYYDIIPFVLYLFLAQLVLLLLYETQYYCICLQCCHLCMCTYRSVCLCELFFSV